MWCSSGECRGGCTYGLLPRWSQSGATPAALIRTRVWDSDRRSGRPGLQMGPARRAALGAGVGVCRFGGWSGADGCACMCTSRDSQVCDLTGGATAQPCADALLPKLKRKAEDEAADGKGITHDDIWCLDLKSHQVCNTCAQAPHGVPQRAGTPPEPHRTRASPHVLCSSRWAIRGCPPRLERTLLVSVSCSQRV